MADRIINIQDAFLNCMRKNKVPVTVFLLNGVKLYGIISCFDQRTVVVKREGHSQLVYKHAISTYSPHGNISVFDWNGTITEPKFKKHRQKDEEVTETEEDDDFCDCESDCDCEGECDCDECDCDDEDDDCDCDEDD